MPRTIVIQNPYHDYAARFIELAHRVHGLSTVCVYTDRRRRVESMDRWPVLQSQRIAGELEVPERGVEQVIYRIAARHEVVAVIPHVEETVLPAAQMAEALGIAWSPVEVIRLFRDKFAMKEHLRTRAPDLRVNASRRVHGVPDVFPGGGPLFERYVLKPNAGFGNQHVAAFDAGSSRSEVRAYFARTQRFDYVLEEWVEGPEFFVNGHVDSQGAIQVVAVFAYQRVRVNGRRDIDWETSRLASTEPLFATCAQYATRVIAATGLRRSPFHLELKIDAKGPCLIEVGARLPGMGNAHECNTLHGGALDLFEVTLRDYLGAGDLGALALDWAHHDATQVRYVHGISTRKETAHTVEGLAAVEGMPSFLRWVKRPWPGQALEPTSDCLTHPWTVVLSGPGQADLTSASEQVRASIRYNHGPPSWDGVLGRARLAGRRARRTVRWQLQRFAPPLEGSPPSAREKGPQGRMRQGAALAGQLREGLERRLLERGVGRRYRGQLAQALTPGQLEQTREVLAWVRDFLAQPHPKLGRPGPVCPFIQHTVDLDQLYLKLHPELDGTEPTLIRDLLVSHADDFKARYPYQAPDGGFTGLLVLLPNVAPARMGVLDELQSELKADLIESDVMLAVFHPGSRRTAIWNPQFEAYRSPVPCFAVRHLDTRDVIFLGHNARGFAHFRRRFGERFEAGEVDDQFGYLTAYREAQKRFGAVAGERS